MKLKNYSIEWESSDSDDYTFIENSNIIKNDNLDLDRQNLNILIVRRKISLDKLATDLVAALGVVASSPDKLWIKMTMALFVVCSISPFNVKIFKESGIDDVFNIISSDFGDHYLDEKDLNSLYTKKPELESIVDFLIRKEIINKPEDGKLFFKGNILKNVSIYENK